MQFTSAPKKVCVYYEMSRLKIKAHKACVGKSEWVVGQSAPVVITTIFTVLLQSLYHCHPHTFALAFVENPPAKAVSLLQLPPAISWQRLWQALHTVVCWRHTPPAPSSSHLPPTTAKGIVRHVLKYCGNELAMTWGAVLIINALNFSLGKLTFPSDHQKRRRRWMGMR